ncbi:RNA polymerase sigma-70 factor [Sinomicrobium weinanense]|uniref:RNA polymerase sigma-70 factor n=1 Tax=Sinomicrobium weinanense TaxID=2842200 RepID=A0A926Q3V5_9FLAO|nr:RNA polymerase sigma-70 factor [Sinomicrobium weinanense]MBC9797319.1 RNA polymerase sigma-70 factor [Sinomicrobium weinanense]MBU3122788.1 RNA polymerase sigma-70 factor [Sinomicrobium weinanense]
MTQANSNNLIYLVKQGDERAFETLYHLYANNLFVIAKSYLRDDYLAEEVVQDIFISLWDRRKDLHIRGNMGGYLFKMVKNRCLDILRKPRKLVSMEDEATLLENKINFKALQDKEASFLLEEELEKRIEEAVALLPKTCKKVFLKTKMDGLNYKQTAEELHISVKTVESHMTKALKHMRLHLREFLSCFSLIG